MEEKIKKIREQILSAFKDLRFEGAEHRYFLGNRELMCVSDVTHKFHEEFDTDRIANNYAHKYGNTAEYWKAEWKRKADDAAAKGTLVHEFAESLMNVRQGNVGGIVESAMSAWNGKELVPRNAKECAVVEFFNRELSSNYYFVLAETRVYSGVNPGAPKLKTDYAGTFDLLMYKVDVNKPENSGLVIFDYKTNKDLENSFSQRFGKMLYHPFGDMYDENLSLYTLQQSCYQIPLEDIGLKVIERNLVWLKDDGTYELKKLRNVTNTLRAVL